MQGRSERFRPTFASLAESVPGWAQPGSDQRVTLVVPFPAGGTIDTVGRMLAQSLSERTGVHFAAENCPGGNATIGSTSVARAAPDGRTLLLNASTFITSAYFIQPPPYDPATDFTPIALVAKAPLSVAVSQDAPFADMRSMLVFAKQNPGKLRFAVGSPGSAGHFATELLQRNWRIDVQVKHYTGADTVYKNLRAGQVEVFIDPVLGATAVQKAGKIRILAVTSGTRLPMLPNVPTVGETITGFEFFSWYGLWGPAGLPAEVTMRINRDVNTALLERMKQWLEWIGIQLAGGTPDEFARFQAAQAERAFALLKETNMTAP